jgi:hypothetical protein
MECPIFRHAAFEPLHDIAVTTDNLAVTRHEFR